MSQSRIDSFMEAVCNTAIGFVISLVTWIIVAWAMSIPMTWSQNLLITGIFTVVSIARSYLLRRAFNGRSVWQAIQERYVCPCREFTKARYWYDTRCVRCGNPPEYNGCH